MRPQKQTQVLIVGAGPAGLALAIELSRFGVKTLMVERRASVSTLPRATGVSTRTMEILRMWGLESKVRAAGVDVNRNAWRSHTLASADGVEVQLTYPNDRDAARWSPTTPGWIPQDQLEPILIDHLAAQPKATIRLGCELIGLDHHAHGVTATIRDCDSGEVERIRAGYLVGADGIRSTVRQMLEIPFAGNDRLSEHGVAMFRAPYGAIADERRYALNLITHPDASGLMMPLGGGDRWGFTYESTPERPALDGLDRDALARLIATAAGAGDALPSIEYVGTATFGAQVADRYRHGRVFLAGDAAHRVTPRGGTGLNLAVKDGFDLGWKLGWVLRSWAKPELLDSYEAERRPVGIEHVIRSTDLNASQRPLADAVNADLGGRIPHVWVDRGAEDASTVDLIGDGATVLAGPQARPRLCRMRLGRLPVDTHRLDPDAARELGIETDGLMVLRPDGRELVMR
jgi:2-polyprenyl-6-methoxyphenol hydroxylase-like FAD-dependent oxidoreductase